MRRDSVGYERRDLVLDILVVDVRRFDHHCALRFQSLCIRERGGLWVGGGRGRTVGARKLGCALFGPNADDGAVGYVRAGEEDSFESAQVGSQNLSRGERGNGLGGRDLEP